MERVLRRGCGLPSARMGRMTRTPAQSAPQRKRSSREGRGHRFSALLLALDLLLAGVIVGGDYWYNYRMPHGLTFTGYATLPDAAGGPLPGGKTGVSENGQGTFTDFRGKFADHFTDTVVSTDTAYSSPDIAVTLTQKTYDSGAVDYSDSGSHIKYGSLVSYTLADIYVNDIRCLQTVFAQDAYGTGFAEGLCAMSARIQSVLAVNGDSYSNNRHKNNGTIIRNGRVYRTQPTSEETCVLYRDGTMKTYGPDSFDARQVILDGAWQTWVFGPSLLDGDGNAKTEFLTWDYITQSHPRTAIGYYEPGHYCLLVVDGRNPGYSRGMFLSEMSRLFADLGCKAAYNLDGGHSSFMTKGTAVASNPYKPGKGISDGIFLCEWEA